MLTATHAVYSLFVRLFIALMVWRRQVRVGVEQPGRGRRFEIQQRNLCRALLRLQIYFFESISQSLVVNGDAHIYPGNQSMEVGASRNCFRFTRTVQGYTPDPASSLIGVIDPFLIGRAKKDAMHGSMTNSNLSPPTRKLGHLADFSRF
jgi:hypothetical protein